MDFGLAPAVTAALHAAVARGDTAYPYPALEERRTQAAVAFWRDRFGWRVDPAGVFSAPDVVEGIRRAIVHLTPAGSPVVLHTPVYFPFFSMVERAGRSLVEVPSRRDGDGRYRIDSEAVAEALAGGAGCVVLCNPWNPVGRALTLDEIAAVTTAARRYGARVIADEVHAPLVLGATRHVPAAVVDPDTVVTVTSASKAWNIPGLKCAEVVLTRDEDRERWSTYFTPEKVGVGTLGLVAAAAAYAEGGGWLDEVRALLERNRSLLDALIAEDLPDAGYRSPEATYLAWIDFRPYGLAAPAAYFLAEARVALSEGAPFGGDGTGHARLNFATPAEILTEIVVRIGRSLRRRRRRSDDATGYPGLVTDRNRRRIDQVLGPDFTERVSDLPLEELRRRRDLAEEVERELSFYRRLIHGRMDLIAFELRRRRGEESKTLLEALPEILAEGLGGGVEPGRLRHLTVELDLPEVTGRRDIDKVLDDGATTRITTMSEEELISFQDALAAAEKPVSEQRGHLHEVIDRLQGEIIDRYRRGLAGTDTLA